MSDVIANDGTFLPLDSMEMTFEYNGDAIDYSEVIQAGNTYRRSYTYVDGKVSKVSKWEKQ